MTQATINAVVLAGGINNPAMQEATGETNRALTRLGDRTMLEHVVSALRGAAGIGMITVVGTVPASMNYQHILPGETLMDNLLIGIQASDSVDAGPILIATSDIPFLTSDGTADFISQARSTGADFCYPIIPMNIYRQRYPTIKRTTLRLREGVFTGGNLLLLNPEFILAHRETVMQAYAARKSVLNIGRMLGWRLLARIILAQTIAPNQLTIPILESGVARLLGNGCRTAAIVTNYPEIGTDVDKPEDIAAARQILGHV